MRDVTSCVLQVREDEEKVGALTKTNDQSNIHSTREKKREIIFL